MHFGVQEHLTTIRRHWGKVVLVMLVSTMLTGAVAFLSSKVYVSQARILLLNTSPAERAVRPSSGDLRGGFSSPQDQVLTQVAILKSPALAEELAIQLGPERVLEEMAWRWDWLRELPSEIKDDIILWVYSFSLGEQLLSTIGIVKPMDVVASGPPIAAARDKLMDGLRAEAIVKTDMFGAAFAAPSGEFAAEALNGMIDVYVEHMVELRRPFDTAAIAEKEAKRLEASLGDAEEDLRAFSEQFDILSIERQKELLLDRWSRLQDELSRAQGNLQETQSRVAVIEDQIETLPRQESISVTTRPNPVVDRLRERLVQLQAESQRYVAGSAAALRLRREIETISAQLNDEAQAVSGQQTVGSSTLYQQLVNRVTLETAEKEALEVRILFLEREVEAVDVELRRVVGHELEYRQLARAVEAREEAYRFALLKREETAIQTLISQSSLAQVVPVERGDVPARAASPRRMRLVALGIIAGLLAGIGLAYALEFSRRTISTAKEAELAVGLPVLAVTERYGLLAKRLKRTRLDLRRFAVWLMRQTAPNRGMRLVFASAHAKTGQTMLVSELALALQKQGLDVLTLRLNVDDQTVLNVTVEPDALGSEAERNDVVVVRAPAWEMTRSVRDLLARLGQDQTLTLVSGDRHAALATGALPTVLARFPKTGVVLIDAPNLSQFPEFGSLAQDADQVIPVVEADRTRITEIGELVQALKMMEIEPPGVVLTKRRMTKTSWAFGWTASTQRKLREQA